MSLDGYIAGPNQTVEAPLSENGMLLHEWVFRLASFRERHGGEGGVRNADDEIREIPSSRGSSSHSRTSPSTGVRGRRDRWRR